MDNNGQQTRVGLGVYILSADGQVLLLKRQGSHGEGTWCPPGGHLEFGEGFDECAKREAKEETGLDVQEIEIIGVTNDKFEEGKHYVTIHTKAKIWTGTPHITEPVKCLAMGWFPLDQLPSPLFLTLRNLLDSDIACLCGSGKSNKTCHGA